MHTLAMLLVGLLLLALFAGGAAWLNRSRGSARLDGPFLFIWVWLAACVVNFWVGVSLAGVSAIVELGVFLVVFGVPAAAAVLLRRWLRSTR